MKNYCLCVTLFLCIINTSSIGQDKQLEKNDSVKRSEDHKNIEYLEKNDGLGNITSSYFHQYENYDSEYIGNPDLDAKIERPCRVYDLNCIRKFFAEHSKCTIRRGPLPKTLFISQESLYFSSTNLTTTPTNFRIGGFRNTRIEEFYLNRRTNNVVFSIQIRGLSMDVPSGYLRFYRNGREPIVIVTEVGTIFPSLIFTAIIPNIKDLKLEKAEITAYVEALPAFILGPEVINNTDLTVTQSLVEFYADVPTIIQELIFTDAQQYPPAYIQYNICDFGLKVLPID